MMGMLVLELPPGFDLLLDLAFISPFAIPIIFAIYAVKKRQFTLRALFLFVTIEAMAVFVFTWIIRTAGPQSP